MFVSSPTRSVEWVPGRYTVLGTDGFGRSDTRPTLRRHFEIDAECIAFAALSDLAAEGQVRRSEATRCSRRTWNRSQ